MPAEDAYHQAVRNALVKDGWTIARDPYTLSFGQREVFVDLGAERPIAAERAGRRIAGIALLVFNAAREVIVKWTL